MSTTYVSLQPPFKIIKHGNKIGVQIGIQMVTFSGGTPFKNETHNYPVVAVENVITPFQYQNISFDNNSEGEVWDNVESKHVSVLCEQGIQLHWMDFIQILWHDHDRLGKLCQRIQKVHIFQHLLKYNKSQELPSPGIYTIHLHTEPSRCMPEVVCSGREDVFALNVEWADDPAALEQSIVDDLMEYLVIISPNRSTRLWKMTYETNEERLRPLVDRLNSNAKATSFRNTMMASITVTAIPPYEDSDDDTNKKDSTPPPGKRGRKGVPAFEEYIMKDAPEGLIDVLTELLDGKTGKPAFTIILAITGKWIYEPPIQSVLNKFPSIKKTSYENARSRHLGINRYLGKGCPISDNKLLEIQVKIEKKLKEKSTD